MLNVRIQAPAFVVENGDVIRDAKQRSRSALTGIREKRIGSKSSYKDVKYLSDWNHPKIYHKGVVLTCHILHTVSQGSTDKLFGWSWTNIPNIRVQMSAGTQLAPILLLKLMSTRSIIARTPTA
jgi:hypothetical protein